MRRIGEWGWVIPPSESGVRAYRSKAEAFDLRASRPAREGGGCKFQTGGARGNRPLRPGVRKAFIGFAAKGISF